MRQKDFGVCHRQETRDDRVDDRVDEHKNALEDVESNMTLLLDHSIR